MAYSVAADIESEFKKLSFTTGPVSTAEVTEFIVQADAIIDSKIGRRYVTPVTADASALSILKFISIGCVVQRVRDILEVKNISRQVDQEVKREDIGARAKKLLDQIANKLLDLPGATLVSTGDGVNSFNADNGTEYFHKKNDSPTQLDW